MARKKTNAFKMQPNCLHPMQQKLQLST